MTATEFYNQAVIIAEKNGYKNPQVTIFSMVSYVSGLKHSCQIWDTKKRKHINTLQHNNPKAALEEFEDTLKFENKTYSKTEKDIDL